ncbi:MAG: hypothetical protein PHT78_12975 [Desulfitobacteriaceae bacterium]|nr:hypothetical protein [Desulfitobacteriaceae bacterium]
MTKIDMLNIGLTEKFIQEAVLFQWLFIGRVSAQSQDLYQVITEKGALTGEIPGNHHQA